MQDPPDKRYPAWQTPQVELEPLQVVQLDTLHVAQLPVPRTMLSIFQPLNSVDTSVCVRKRTRTVADVGKVSGPTASQAGALTLVKFTCVPLPLFVQPVFPVYAGLVASPAVPLVLPLVQ